jgi:enediyne biosynthesis protein E4
MLRSPAIVLAMLLACPAKDDGTESAVTTDSDTTITKTVPPADFQPRILDGEVTIGIGGQVIVDLSPALATVDLYRGTLQGAGPCEYGGAGLCAGIVDPEFVATLTTDASGMAVYEVELADFPTPTGIVWQALVHDPDQPEVAAFTDAIARHAAISPADARVTFDKVTLRAGLLNNATNGNTHTGGMAFIDVNNDYLPDIYIVNGHDKGNLLYMNRGDGTFAEESWRAQKPAGRECAGVTYADLENDGDLDMVVPVDNPNIMQSSVPQSYFGGPNLVFVNDGTGVFTEAAAGSGVVDPRGWRSSNGQFADYDLDGCIDLYLLQWAMAAEPGLDNTDRILRGNCDGTFTDVSDQNAMDPSGRDGLGLLWWDANDDLYPELWVANNSDQYDPPVFDPEHDYYMNLGGTFERWNSHNDNDALDGWAGMGMDVGDIDGDLDWDLYITDVWYLDSAVINDDASVSVKPYVKGNPLYLGSPDGTLSANACQERNICFGYNSWPTNFMDFDNDGWVDLWVGASVASDPMFLYLNRGDGTGAFDPVRVNGWTGYINRGGTAADYDGDGDVDVFNWVEGGSGSQLWENMQQEPNHWLELRLIGTDSNWAAVGAYLRITTDGYTQLRRVSGGDSAHSQTDLAVHVGLGDQTSADQVEIRWPSGNVQVLTDVAGDRFWLVNEDSGLVSEELSAASATWDAGAQVVVVSVQSNYGGRPHFTATGLGPLTYDLDTLSHVGSLPASSPPAQIDLVSDLGGAITVPVMVP